MKVSIVIPAHNEESHIKACIESAIKQNYHNFEIIVVDNASTDKTAEIAKNYGIKVVLETRKGTQWARESGRLHACGEIIANLDADCLPDSDWLTKGVNSFLSKKVVAVGGPYDYYDASNFFRKFSLFFQKTFYFLGNKLLQKLGKGAILIGGNVFLRADVLDSVGGYNTKLVFYGDDTDTAKRMAKHGEVVFNRNLIMKTSARRLKNEGSVRQSLKYFYHFFRIIFTNH